MSSEKNRDIEQKIFDLVHEIFNDTQIVIDEIQLKWIDLSSYEHYKMKCEVICVKSHKRNAQ